jgi:hypothetical protein
MNAKELICSHCTKSASHHDALAKAHRKIAKAHVAAADAGKDQTIAQAHRDLATHHVAVAEVHDDQQKHFELMREELAEASDAEVLDSRQDSTRDMQHAARDGFLRAIGVLPPD